MNRRCKARANKSWTRRVPCGQVPSVDWNDFISIYEEAYLAGAEDAKSRIKMAKKKAPGGH